MSQLSPSEEPPATREPCSSCPTPPRDQGIFSEETFYYFDIWVNYVILSILALFGLVTNILDLIVFFHQGFKDSVNVSLTAMAFWDLLMCICTLCHRFHRPVSQISPVTSLSWSNVTIIYVEYTFIISSNVTYALASYVSVERCLHVSMPFKVKSIFTARFTFVAVSLISVVVFFAHAIVYLLFDIAKKHNEEYNVTVLINIFSDFYGIHGQVVMVYYNILGMALPFASFAILCLASLITVYYLRKSCSKIARHTGTPLYRLSQGNPHISSSGSKGSNSEFTSVSALNGRNSLSKVVTKNSNSPGMRLTAKEKQVIKMLLVILVIYIVTLFPKLLFYAASLIEPKFSLRQQYHKLYISSSKVLFCFDLLNASTNLFVFLHMSSNYRATFFFVFGGPRKRV